MVMDIFHWNGVKKVTAQFFWGIFRGIHNKYMFNLVKLQFVIS